MATRMLKAAADKYLIIKHIGTAAADDPTDLSNIATTTASLAYPINGAEAIVVHVFGDTNVTGNVTVEVAPTGSGPWVILATVANPTTAGAITPVPFGDTAEKFIRINTAGGYTGGPVRGTLMANFPNGNNMW